MKIIEKHYIKSETNIYTTFLDIPLEYKKECIQEAYKIGDHQGKQTNVKATMSKWQIWEQTKVFNKIINNIFSVINYVWPNIDEKVKYDISNVWSAIYKKGDFTARHYHVPSYISWVYYLQSSGNTPLVFDKCDMQIEPLDDMLIIFPSYLIHSVPIHEEEEDRICLAGNINLIANEEYYANRDRE